MSNSLGTISKAAAAPPPRSAAVIDIPAPAKKTSVTVLSGLAILDGFVPTLLFALLFGAAPIVYFYNEGATADYTATNTRVLTIAASAGAGAIVYMSRCSCMLYQLALFLHIGMEVYVTDHALQYARDSANTDVARAFAYTGAVVVILHLIPFLLAERPKLLSFLAFVGMPINTVLILYTMPAMATPIVFFVGITGSVLFAATLVFAFDDQPITLLSLLREGMQSKSYLRRG